MMAVYKIVSFLAILAVVACQNVTNGPVEEGPTPMPVTAALCAFNPCTNGGTCLRKDEGSYTCVCPAGFGGIVCELTVQMTTMATTKTPCPFNPCLNGGTCELTDGSYQCWCPSTYSGQVCQNAVPTAPPTTAEPCPDGSTITENNIGCRPAEVVFLLEYGVQDNRWDIDHEGDFIKEMIDHWTINERQMQIGVVTYHDTVEEAIHIGLNDSRVLKAQISNLTRNLRPSGQPDLAKALLYARNNSFQGARPGVPRVLMPIVHDMTNDPEKLRDLVNVAQGLKDECITIIPFGVQGRDYNRDISHQIATSPWKNHHKSLDDFDDLEELGEDYRQNCASGSIVG